MIAWIKGINWGKTLVVGFLYTIFSVIIQSVLAGPKVGIMSIVLTLATGISIAIIYYYVKDMLPKKFVRRMLFFADLMIGFSFIFFTLPTYLLFNIPIGLLISWFISSFIILVFASFISVKIIGK